VPGLASAITFGVTGLLSLVWLGLVHRYVSDGPGWENLLASHPTDFSVFLAAVGAPLGALWLVAAFVLLAIGQGRLQAALVRAHWQAGRTTEEIEALVRTSIEMQEQARRQSFLSGVDLALKDLNSQAGMIVGRLGILAAEDTEYLWALNAAGDPWAFCHALLERSIAPGFVEDVADRVVGDEVALAGLHRFLRRYERLLALAREYDADKLVCEVLEDGPLDRVHALFRTIAWSVQARLTPPPTYAEGLDDGAVPDEGNGRDESLAWSREPSSIDLGGDPLAGLQDGLVSPYGPTVPGPGVVASATEEDDRVVWGGAPGCGATPRDRDTRGGRVPHGALTDRLARGMEAFREVGAAMGRLTGGVRAHLGGDPDSDRDHVRFAEPWPEDDRSGVGYGADEGPFWPSADTAGAGGEAQGASVEEGIDTDRMRVIEPGQDNNGQGEDVASRGASGHPDLFETVPAGRADRRSGGPTGDPVT